MTLKISFPSFIAFLYSLPRKYKTLMVAIDGCGGAGKSTFAEKLQQNSSDITVVHNDDFYRPSWQRLPREKAFKTIGADFDWQRLESQVLKKLQSDTPGYYQNYDWRPDKMADWHNVPVGGIVVVEGIFSTRAELAHYYDLKIWLECPADMRLTRGVARDGAESLPVWQNNWMPSEEYYKKEYAPEYYADLIIDASRSSPSIIQIISCADAFAGLIQKTNSD